MLPGVSSRCLVALTSIAILLSTARGAHAQVQHIDFEDWPPGCLPADLCPGVSVEVYMPSTLLHTTSGGCWSGACVEATWQHGAGSSIVIHPSFVPPPRALYAEGTFRLAPESADPGALLDREIKLFVIYDTAYVSEIKVEILGPEIVVRAFDVATADELPLSPPASIPILDLTEHHRVSVHMTMETGGLVHGTLFLDDDRRSFDVPFYLAIDVGDSAAFGEVTVFAETYWESSAVSEEVLYVDDLCFGPDIASRDECGALRIPAVPDAGVPPTPDGGVDRPRETPLGGFRGGGGCACDLGRAQKTAPPGAVPIWALVLVLLALRRIPH